MMTASRGFLYCMERCTMLTIASGYDPLYLTRAVATVRENYYLSAVAEHGEPPGIWTGRGSPELGLRVGSEVDNTVMERLYGAFADPRDPTGEVALERAPSGFAGNNDKVAALIAARLDHFRVRRHNRVGGVIHEYRLVA
jgi:hypothetical protein